MGRAGAVLGTIDDVRVEVDRSNDYGEPSNAQLKAVELAVRRDTLLIVGHFARPDEGSAPNLPSCGRTTDSCNHNQRDESRPVAPQVIIRSLFVKDVDFLLSYAGANL
jgi:hypothetical protein